MQPYVKLRDLVGSTFEVKSVNGYTFKFWDNTEKKMLSSDVYIEGYSKKYQVETNKGMLDLGSGQLGNLLEAVFYQGKADLIGKTFEVKSNGKEGMDIRYYFNVLKEAPKQPQLPDTNDIDVSEIPF
jgi:hypothetical protein